MIDNMEFEDVPCCTQKDYEIIESKLKRRSSRCIKAQLLRNIASELMQSDNQNMQCKGVSVMLDMINNYADEDYAVMTGHSILGRYYREKKDYDKAMDHYKIIMEHNRKVKSDCKGIGIGIPEMELAQTIIELNHVEDYDYARDVMTHVEPGTLFIEKEKQQYNHIMQELNS